MAQGIRKCYLCKSTEGLYEKGYICRLCNKKKNFLYAKKNKQKIKATSEIRYWNKTSPINRTKKNIIAHAPEAIKQVKKEKSRHSNKRWTETNPEMARFYARSRRKKGIRNLADWYIKERMKSKGVVITKESIEEQRQMLIKKRAKRNK